MAWFVSGPGAGYLTYEIMEIPTVKAWLKPIQLFMMGRLGRGERESKRIVAFLLAALLSMAGYGVMMWAGWQPRPVGWEEFLNEALQISGVSGVVSQLIHGGAELDGGDNA